MSTEFRKAQLKQLSDEWVQSQKEHNNRLAVALIGYKDAIIADYLTVTESNLTDHSVEFSIGRKYIKIIFKPWNSSKYVHSFVEKTTGDIWKAASFRSPAKNFSRGNVLKYHYPTLRWSGI